MFKNILKGFGTQRAQVFTLFVTALGYTHYTRFRNGRVNFFVTGTANIPHPDKVEKGGEDALSHTKNMLCVADGVGSWNNCGVDPGLWSKQLVKNIRKKLTGRGGSKKYLSDPSALMNDAVQMGDQRGSSTIVITTLDKRRGVLYGANLGDSGYMIVRFD